MKKSHRVAHEKSEAWWVLLILLYSFRCYCQAFFCKNRQLSIVFVTVQGLAGLEKTDGVD